MVDLDAELFVCSRTAPTPVPLVPELRVYTAEALTPVWREIEDVPYWCVPWAGGQAVARYLLDRPETVRGKRVLDFGTGGGLVALAAALAGASRVSAVDIDPLATAAASLNAALNSLAIDVFTADVVGASDVDADVVLAGDIWYERASATRFDAWLRALSARVVTGDPGRSYVPADLVELGRYDVPTTLELEGAASKTTRVLAFP